MAELLRAHWLRHIRARGHHPQTIGKVERWHRTMKNEVTLVLYMSPEELRRALGEFVEYYNREHCHEALKNVTPDDFSSAHREAMLVRRKALEVGSVVPGRQLASTPARGPQHSSAKGPGRPSHFMLSEDRHRL
ncbi:MAG: transposase [Armatimonadota bacterium]|nr:MAG: transposase [Armatimonadota bacterium]